MDIDIDVSPEFKTIDRGILATLPKVVLWHPVTADNVAAELRRLADDGVIYAELQLRTTSDEDLHHVLHALAAAPIVAGVVLAAGSPSEIETAMSLAAAHRGAVVGFAFIEDARPTMEAVSFLRKNFLPIVSQDVALGVECGADRICGAMELYEDFSVSEEGISAGPLSAYIRDREIVLDFAFRAAKLADIADHPLPLLQQLGFTCTLNPQSMTLSEEFELLVEGFDYGLEELFSLTCAAMEGAFAPIELRRALLEDQIIPAYQKFVATDD